MGFYNKSFSISSQTVSKSQSHFSYYFPILLQFHKPLFSQSVDFGCHLLYFYLFSFICICASMHCIYFLKKTSVIFFSALCVWNTILRSEQCLWKPIKGRNVILASYWKVTQSTEKSRKPKEEINFYFYVRILPLTKLIYPKKWLFSRSEI